MHTFVFPSIYGSLHRSRTFAAVFASCSIICSVCSSTFRCAAVIQSRAGSVHRSASKSIYSPYLCELCCPRPSHSPAASSRLLHLDIRSSTFIVQATEKLCLLDQRWYFPEALCQSIHRHEARYQILYYTTIKVSQQPARHDH